MKKKLVQILGMCLTVLIAVAAVPKGAEAAEYITVSEFADMVEDALGGDVTITDKTVPESGNSITKAQALYLVNRAHEIKYGSDFHTKRYSNTLTGLTKEYLDINYSRYIYYNGEPVKDIMKKYWAQTREGLYKDGEEGFYGITTPVHELTQEEIDEIYRKQYYDTQYKMILERGRISDLGKTEKSLRDGVIKAYMRGYIKGKSDGKCSQSRSLKAHKQLKEAAAEKMVQKLVTQKGLAGLSPDGQLLRTKKLPKTASRYEYILANFPNSFYEYQTWYEGFTDREGNLLIYKEFEDYLNPVNLKQTKRWWGNDYHVDKYGEIAKRYVREVLDVKKQMWCDKIETNLKCRLGFNYATVNEKAWVQTLADTYIGDCSSSMYEYIKNAKKNRVVVEYSDIAVEPSSMYEYDGNFYVRAYARYRVKSDNFNGEEGENQTKLIFGHWGKHWLEGLKNNVWHEGYYDIKLGTSNTEEVGDTLGVTADWLHDR